MGSIVSITGAVILLSLLSKCGADSDKDFSSVDVPADLYDVTLNRLIRNHLENGWVVSRYTDTGATEHEGDSLLWTGLAMAAVKCEDGHRFEQHLIESLQRNEGALVRYEPLGEYRGGREISLDGATGLFFGVLHRLLFCNRYDVWSDAWRLHTEQRDRNYGRLNPDAAVVVEPQFTVLPDYISHLLSQRGKPHSDRIQFLASEIVTWALATKIARKSCFRMHIGWLYLRALELLDELPKGQRDFFCKATNSTDVPLIDHWCKRKHISRWLLSYEHDQWEYRHQRCGKWEDPDGRQNMSTPGVDVLVGLYVNEGDK